VNQLFGYKKLYNFQVYLVEKLEDAEFYKLNNDPILEILRRSPRNTNKKPTNFKPMLQFNKTKTKKQLNIFLKRILLQYNIEKKVMPFYIYNVYLINLFFSLPQ